MGLMSYVKIVIGDNGGNRIILPTTWKVFIERRANVEQLAITYIYIYIYVIFIGEDI